MEPITTIELRPLDEDGRTVFQSPFHLRRPANEHPEATLTAPPARLHGPESPRIESPKTSRIALSEPPERPRILPLPELHEDGLKFHKS